MPFAGDPKAGDFWNELLPNSQGAKNSAYISLNPTKSHSKPLVSKVNEKPNVGGFPWLPAPLLLYWELQARVVLEKWWGPLSPVLVLKALVVPACEVHVLTLQRPQ